MAAVASSAFDNTPFSASSRTFAYTHGGGPLVVITVSRIQTVTGVTANGSAMTSLGSQLGAASLYTEVWYLNDIAAFTTQNIVVTYAGNLYYAATHVLSFSGATATPFSGFNSGVSVGGSTAPTVTISSATGELVVACLVNIDTAATHTIGSGQTLVRDDAATNGSDATVKHRLVTTTEAGAASVVMDGTLSQAEIWSAVGFSVAASGGGGGGGEGGAVYLRQLMGMQ